MKAEDKGSSIVRSVVMSKVEDKGGSGDEGGG